MLKLGANSRRSFIKFRFSSFNSKVNSNFIVKRQLDGVRKIKITSDPKKNSEEMLKIISNKISTEGPIGLDDYMRMCLYDKNFGYYTTKEYIFGEKGDFITSPEISSLFGERVGIFIANALETSFNFPDEYDLLEIGAGRGFLMADIITTLISCNMAKGLNVVIVETSPKLIKIQQENITNTLNKKKFFTEYITDKENRFEKFVNKSKKFSITWYKDLDMYVHDRNKIILEDTTKNPLVNTTKFVKAKEIHSLNPLIIINNEFFDALPIKKFIYKDSKWRELLVGLDKKSSDNSTNKEDKLIYTMSEPNNSNVVKILDPDRTFSDMKLEDGYAYEFSIEQIKYMHSLCYLMSTSPKAIGLFCDYGDDHSFSDSFRGIKNQTLIKGDEILLNSGICDLTSYINFKALSRVVYQYDSLKYGGLMTQGDFLYYMHITTRGEEVKSTDPKMKESIDNSIARLINDDQMGSTYKFLYIHKARMKPSYPFLDDILDDLKYNKPSPN